MPRMVHAIILGAQCATAGVLLLLDSSEVSVSPPGHTAMFRLHLALIGDLFQLDRLARFIAYYMYLNHSVHFIYPLLLSHDITHFTPSS